MPLCSSIFWQAGNGIRTRDLMLGKQSVPKIGLVEIVSQTIYKPPFSSENHQALQDTKPQDSQYTKWFGGCLVSVIFSLNLSRKTETRVSDLAMLKVKR
jgi:hypothetical protein